MRSPNHEDTKTRRHVEHDDTTSTTTRRNSHKELCTTSETLTKHERRRNSTPAPFALRLETLDLRRDFSVRRRLYSSNSFINELLKPLAFVRLHRIDIPLRVEREVVHRVELTRIPAAIAEVADDLQRLAIRSDPVIQLHYGLALYWRGELAAARGPSEDRDQDAFGLGLEVDAGGRGELGPSQVQRGERPRVHDLERGSSELRFPSRPAQSPQRVLSLTLEDRHYRIRGLGQNTSPDLLKVNLLVRRGDQVHVDTLDLYAARSRASFVAQAAAELGLDPTVLRKDLGTLLLRCEGLQGVLATALDFVAVTVESDCEEHLAVLICAVAVCGNDQTDEIRGGCAGLQTPGLHLHVAAV